jgi:hypothetical protein
MGAALALSAVLLAGSGPGAVGAEDTATGPDITKLKLDRNGADIFPSDNRSLQCDGKSDDSTSDAADPANLNLDRNGADIFPEDQTEP